MDLKAYRPEYRSNGRRQNGSQAEMRERIEFAKTLIAEGATTWTRMGDRIAEAFNLKPRSAEKYLQRAYKEIGKRGRNQKPATPGMEAGACPAAIVPREGVAYEAGSRAGPSDKKPRAGRGSKRRRERRRRRALRPKGFNMTKLAALIVSPFIQDLAPQVIDLLVQYTVELAEADPGWSVGETFRRNATRFGREYTIAVHYQHDGLHATIDVCRDAMPSHRP